MRFEIDDEQIQELKPRTREDVMAAYQAMVKAKAARMMRELVKAKAARMMRELEKGKE